MFSVGSSTSAFPVSFRARCCRNNASNTLPHIAMPMNIYAVTAQHAEKIFRMYLSYGFVSTASPNAHAAAPALQIINAATHHIVAIFDGIPPSKYIVTGKTNAISQTMSTHVKTAKSVLKSQITLRINAQ